MIKALVVDDEFFGREELSGYLQETKSMEVSECRNGEEALQKIKEERFDVVFLDIDMPGMSGLEVARELVKMESSPLVVFTTAYHQYAVEAFEANAVDYVLKPYQPERLQKALTKIKEAGSSHRTMNARLSALEKYLVEKGHFKKPQ